MYEDEDKKNREFDVSYSDTFRFIWNYLGNRKLLAFSASAFFILAVIADTILPVYIGKLIDSIIASTGKYTEIPTEIITYFMIVITLKFLPALLSETGEIIGDRMGTLALRDALIDLSAKVQSFSTRWHVNAFAGATARRIIRGSWAIVDIFFIICTNLAPAILVIISTEIMLLHKLPEVALIFLIAVIIYFIFSVTVSVKFIRPRFKKFIKEDTKLSAILNDVIAGISTVKAFASETRESKLIEKQATKLSNKGFRAFWFADTMSMVRSALETLIYAIVLFKTLMLWKAGLATAGDIVLVTSAAAIVLSYLQRVGRMAAQLQRHFNDIEDAVIFWMREIEVTDIEGAASLTMKNSCDKPRIEFDRIAFHYPKTDKNLFENLSVKIANGEKIALVGTSGSGKSSFVKLLQRLYDIQGGGILVDGQNIADVTKKSLREQITLVPQEPILFHRTLKENIAYGRPDATMDEIIEASKKAYIHEFIRDLKEGYDTKVGERGIKLSGGERQRVAIARAILADTPILILDEATSSLDSISEHYVKEAMQTLMEGKTSITIAHRLSTIKQADRILVFQDGKIIEQGKHEELIKNKKSRYKELYEMQSLGILEESEE